MKFILALVLVLCASPVWAFPDNGVLDAFTGCTNDASPPNANWTNAPLSGSSSANVECRSTAIGTATNGTEADAYYDIASFNANQEAYIEMIVVSGTTSYSGVYARLANIGSNTTDGYKVEWFNGDLYISRVDNGVATQLGAAITQAGDANDSIGIRTVGDQICAWFNNDGAGWTEAGCRTDSTYSAGGFIGVTVKSGTDTAQADNFGGGNVTSTRRAVAPILLQ
jgi:hypothetical protein